MRYIELETAEVWLKKASLRARMWYIPAMVTWWPTGLVRSQGDWGSTLGVHTTKMSPCQMTSSKAEAVFAADREIRIRMMLEERVPFGRPSYCNWPIHALKEPWAAGWIVLPQCIAYFIWPAQLKQLQSQYLCLNPAKEELSWVWNSGIKEHVLWAGGTIQGRTVMEWEREKARLRKSRRQQFFQPLFQAPNFQL
jgi:hypothetical protein